MVVMEGQSITSIRGLLALNLTGRTIDEVFLPDPLHQQKTKVEGMVSITIATVFTQIRFYSCQITIMK